MSSTRRTAALFLLVLPAVLGACQSGSKYPPQWRVEEIDVPSDRLLWEVTVFALEKEGYPTGTDLDPSSLEALSGWRYSLAPFRGQGRRERAQILFEPLGPKRYRLQVRVQREVNMDAVRPMDLSYAEWKESPDNAEAALVLVQRIRSWIAPGLELRSKNAPRAPGS
jgi:hypothetical protein